MSRPTLTYFDIPGSRGEECRLALFLSDIDFDDRRVKFQEWAAVKATTPWGSIPTLEIPGKGTFAQTNAILSLIGRKHGLLPDDPFEVARHEEVMCAIEDLRSTIGATMRLPTDEEKRDVRQKLAETSIPAFAAALEGKIEGPFVGGEAISVADLKVFVFVRWLRSGLLDHIPTDLFDGHERILACQAAVENHPKVQAWYAR